jgi:hypothetical protein
MVLVGEYEGSRPLEKSRRKWEDNIKVDIRIVEWRGSEWIDLAQGLAGDWRL